MRLRQQELTVKGIFADVHGLPFQQDKYDILCKLYGLMTIGSSVIFVKGIQPELLAPPLPNLPTMAVAGLLCRRVRVLMRFNNAWRPTGTACLHSMAHLRARIGMRCWTISALASPGAHHDQCAGPWHRRVERVHGDQLRHPHEGHARRRAGRRDVPAPHRPHGPFWPRGSQHHLRP